MRSGKRIFIIIMVLVLLLVGACQSDSAPGPSAGGSSDDTSSELSEETGGESSAGGADLGSATVAYEYLIIDKGIDVKADVDIQVTIERDPNQPEKYLVNGFNTINATLKGTTAAGGSPCYMLCTYTVQYYAEGNLTQHYSEGCKISLKISGDFASASFEKSGDCPSEGIALYDCESLAMSYLDDHQYQFTKEKTIDSPLSDAGRTVIAEIMKVDMPSGMDEACKWGERWE